MKYFVFFLSLLFGLACGNPQPAQEENVTSNTTTVEAPAAPVPDTESLRADERLGAYVGMFNASKYDEGKAPTWSNKITISIDRIEGGKLYGHSVVAGNDRPFEGSIKAEGVEYQVVAQEPGDDQYDGVFTFRIQPEINQIEGIWTANKKNLAVTERSFILEKKSFTYDPSLALGDLEFTEIYNTYNDESGEAEFLTKAVSSKNPSLEELKKEDVENMHKSDLEVMRNAIYARHGYSFKNRKMRYIFNQVDWYMPMHTDIRSELTELEKKNIDLIKRYEQHAERYYDAFGR